VKFNDSWLPEHPVLVRTYVLKQGFYYFILHFLRHEEPSLYLVYVAFFNLSLMLDWPFKTNMGVRPFSREAKKGTVVAL